MSERTCENDPIVLGCGFRARLTRGSSTKTTLDMKANELHSLHSVSAFNVLSAILGLPYTFNIKSWPPASLGVFFRLLESEKQSAEPGELNPRRKKNARRQCAKLQIHIRPSGSFLRAFSMDQRLSGLRHAHPASF